MTLLMQFRNTFPQLSRVIYLQNNRQALTQVSFALLSFYGWHAPKGGQLLFRFLLLSGFLPYPFATYHFFLTFVFVSRLFPFHLTLFFPRRFRCHGDFFNFPPFSCRSFFPALRFEFFSPPLFTSLISHISSTFLFSAILNISGFFPENSGALFSFRHLFDFFFLLIAFLFSPPPFAIMLLATL
ncbi:hypothetical protein [Bartonella apis]|uniref:hypothetical protein n=2 Tax=Bartonella apis TaxID=1686310 RepID=UPI00242DCB16|nr:hypothetical protein [Bartonella apis]MCT6825485.1 hypothetical protein [Bartonella apis]MCT6861412.1 hypothetical protein [Bartonella apis]